MSEQPKREPKAGHDKISLSGQLEGGQKEAAHPDSAAGNVDIPGAGLLTENGAISEPASDLKVECDFRGIVDSDEIEACCYYEYFRESAAMRDSKCAPFFGRFIEPLPNAGLGFMLRKAGFPKPWKLLGADVCKDLIVAFQGASRELFPPFLASELPPTDFDDEHILREHLERWRAFAYQERFPSDETEAFPVEPGRSYFFGVFRLDEAYNETEACAAFGAWFRKRRKGKTQGGNRDRWRSRLNSLVVLRVSKRLKDPKKRVQWIAKLTGLKGCTTYSESLRVNSKIGLGGERISAAARVEMAKARAAANEYFQSLFPGEKPLSYFHEGES